MTEENNEQVETQEEEEQQEEQPKALTAEDVQKMIQSETDKVRTEYSKKLKDVEEEKKKLVQEKMTDEERKEAERKEWEDKLSQKEKDILDKEVTLHTIDELKKNELPLEFREYVKGSDVEETSKRIKDFKKVWTEAINAEVDKRFKGSGRTVEPGSKEQPTDPIADAFQQVFKSKK